ncbi:hypothetical protein ACFRMQ_14515 [Kitasatospora sp. NPDC056783]|uniref:hypothetical protein n=1 Tax=Kitasatospora sp. NPDC056783 TaxID=3345943 RepID=UPI0036A0A75B
MSVAHAAPPTRDEEILIGHSYTRARRHPLVVGKLPGAGRIPGGPYTVTQIVTMVVGFMVLTMTRALWAHFGLLDIVIMIALPWGLAWVMRYARVDGRDPARAIRSLLVYASAPGAGRLAGRPQRRGRIRMTTGRCTVREQDAFQPAPEQPVEPALPTPTPAVRAQPRRSAPSPVSQHPPRADEQTTCPAPAPAVPRVPGAAGRRSPGTRSTLQNLLASLDET